MVPVRGEIAGFRFQRSTCQGVYHLIVVTSGSTSMLVSLDGVLKATLGELSDDELSDDEDLPWAVA